jgi:hypothetical protein
MMHALGINFQNKNENVVHRKRTATEMEQISGEKCSQNQAQELPLSASRIKHNTKQYYTHTHTRRNMQTDSIIMPASPVRSSSQMQFLLDYLAGVFKVNFGLIGGTPLTTHKTRILYAKVIKLTKRINYVRSENRRIQSCRTLFYYYARVRS